MWLATVKKRKKTRSAIAYHRTRTPAARRHQLPPMHYKTAWPRVLDTCCSSNGSAAVGRDVCVPPPNGQEIDHRRRFVSLTVIGVDSGGHGRRRPAAASAERGGRVLKPTLDALVGVPTAPDHRGRGRAVPVLLLLFVRLSVQGHQLGLETFQKPGRRKFGLPVRARLVQHAPRVNDKQQVPVGLSHPTATVVRHGHGGRAVRRSRSRGIPAALRGCSSFGLVRPFGSVRRRHLRFVRFVSSHRFFHFLLLHHCCRGGCPCCRPSLWQS